MKRGRAVAMMQGEMEWEEVGQGRRLVGVVSVLRWSLVDINKIYGHSAILPVVMMVVGRLKSRYPMIRLDLTDQEKELPSFDNFYIDFNALVYQCIRESGCFLKNKVKPLAEQDIIDRVFAYLLELIRTVNPSKLLYIALDGVAPRAKINQSRDRRFKSGIDDIEFFEALVQQIGIKTEEVFQANSISPGTQFLFTLCGKLRAKIMELMGTEWKDLHVIFSDCCVPGEGEHKIMEFLRYSKSAALFTPTTTHCVYSPDADVILLTLALDLPYICIVKEDTSVMPSQSWTASSTYRRFGPPLFELVMINILREYLAQEFEEVLQRVKGSSVQMVINDLVLLMAFIGNDFLPNEFCFVLKDNNLDSLFRQYKDYLLEHQDFINHEGVIDWTNVSKLLKLARRFEAHMISEMKSQRKGRGGHGDGTVFDQRGEKEKEEVEKEEGESELERFEIKDDKIVRGVEGYYQSRFNIQDREQSPEFEKIILSYIEGLEFYCQYYYRGLPSWSWYYPYHYTPLLCDVDDYIIRHKITVQLKQDEPFDPILALMFMLPIQNFSLLPKPVATALSDPACPLRTPKDYFPTKFELDKFQTLKYNQHALIPFLKENEVRRVYEQIPKASLSKEESERNLRRNAQIFYENKGSFTGIEISFNERSKEEVQRLLQGKYREKEGRGQRFPTLHLFGEKLELNDKGYIIPQYRYRHNGNPSELVFFNNFTGYVESSEKATPEVKEEIENTYSGKGGLFGSCENYLVVKRGRYVRELERFHVYPTPREVIVPDFALFRSPNYDYIRRTVRYDPNELYRVRQRVVVLTQKYFGCVGTVEEVGAGRVTVRLSVDPVKSEAKIEEFEEDFFTVEYVVNELDVSKETLLAIVGEVIVLPKMGKKKDFNERLPTSINFGLNFVDFFNAKIVPRFVRCNFQQENTRTPQETLERIEISQSGLKLLERYVGEFHWLVQALEESRAGRRKEFKASSLFAKEKDPNIRLYQEFVKLYEYDTRGPFQSIYSKIANPDLPALFTEKKAENSVVSFNYYEVFSRAQAFIAPPAYRGEPEYHDIGSRVILLRTLEVGYVTAIDDQWIYVSVGKSKRRCRVRFLDLFNESWENYLAKEVGKVWSLDVSYYTPTYWKKAISS